MRIKFSENFYFQLKEIIDFIAKDKPQTSIKFKKELITSLKKDLQNPYSFKKSIYFEDSSYRDYTPKGYEITYEINDTSKTVIIIGIIKNKEKH